jgi:hypothetical protein
MQRDNERGVPSHRWSVNPLAGGPRSVAKRATKIEGSGPATEMGSASDWRSTTEMGSASDGDGFFALRRDSNPKRKLVAGGGGGVLQRSIEHGEGEERGIIKRV